MHYNEGNFKIEFYKGRSAYTVLNRYAFSEEEKKVIYGAILTAKRDNPNMKCINAAEELLKKVALTRDVLPQARDDKDNKELKYATAQLNYSMQPDIVSLDDRKEMNMKKSWYIYMITIIVSYLAYEIFFSYDGWHKEEFGTYNYADAKEVCKTQESELPSLAKLNSLRSYSNYFYQGYLYLTNDNYWVKNDSKPLVYNMRTQKTTEVDANNSYEVKCRYDRFRKK